MSINVEAELGPVLENLIFARQVLESPRRRTLNDLVTNKQVHTLRPPLPHDLTVSFYIQARNWSFRCTPLLRLELLRRNRGYTLRSMGNVGSLGTLGSLGKVGNPVRLDLGRIRECPRTGWDGHRVDAIRDSRFAERTMRFALVGEGHVSARWDHLQCRILSAEAS